MELEFRDVLNGRTSPGNNTGCTADGLLSSLAVDELILRRADALSFSFRGCDSFSKNFTNAATTLSLL